MGRKKLISNFFNVTIIHRLSKEITVMCIKALSEEEAWIIALDFAGWDDKNQEKILEVQILRRN